ncbi:MAG: glycosyltransferase family 4 protein, partial [Pseudomonadota bacterium]
SVIVCPLLSDSGLRIKLLEAMAKGKAIVATQVAAEGLEIEPGTHMIVTDDPAAFARAVCTLLEDAGARESMGKAAQARMEARYSWQVIAERFEAFYQLLITRKSSKNA